MGIYLTPKVRVKTLISTKRYRCFQQGVHTRFHMLYRKLQVCKEQLTARWTVWIRISVWKKVETKYGLIWKEQTVSGNGIRPTRLNVPSVPGISVERTGNESGTRSSPPLLNAAGLSWTSAASAKTTMPPRHLITKSLRRQVLLFTALNFFAC